MPKTGHDQPRKKKAGTSPALRYLKKCRGALLRRFHHIGGRAFSGIGGLVGLAVAIARAARAAGAARRGGRFGFAIGDMAIGLAVPTSDRCPVVPNLVARLSSVIGWVSGGATHEASLTQPLPVLPVRTGVPSGGWGRASRPPPAAAEPGASQPHVWGCTQLGFRGSASWRWSVRRRTAPGTLGSALPAPPRLQTRAAVLGGIIITHPKPLIAPPLHRSTSVHGASPSTPRRSSTGAASRWPACPWTSSCSTCWALGELLVGQRLALQRGAAAGV